MARFADERKPVESQPAANGFEVAHVMRSGELTAVRDNLRAANVHEMYVEALSRGAGRVSVL